MTPTCSGCGHPLKHKARYCTRCGAPVSGARTCPTCGIANDGDSNFCFACGESLVLASVAPPPTTPTASPPSPPSTGARARWLVAGILLGALLFGAGVFGLWLFDR
ncbi:MAG: zinc ribbon domain-containing protein [Myxococcales bacterium]|nr:zinc ribbon domain-containing protein [Myxococcales bacterium]